MNPISIPPPFVGLPLQYTRLQPGIWVLPLFACVFLLYILNLIGSCLSFPIVCLILTFVLPHFDSRFKKFSVHFLFFLTFLHYFSDILFFLFPLYFSWFVSCSLLLIMLCSLLFSMLLICFYFILIFFIVCGVSFIVFWCL